MENIIRPTTNENESECVAGCTPSTKAIHARYVGLAYSLINKIITNMNYNFCADVLLQIR